MNIYEGDVSNNYVEEKSDEQYNVITHMLIKRKDAGAPHPKKKMKETTEILYVQYAKYILSTFIAII